MRYAWAYGVAQSLEDFFKDDNESKPKMRRPWYYDDYDSGQDEKDDDRRLSKRRKLKFLSDSDTNTILVQGADAAQLTTIAELIKVFDQKPPKDSGTDRKTEIFRLRFAKANDVAEAVKDVYRDLLSSNDKALANPQQQQRGGPRMFIYDYNDDGSGKSEQKTPKFKGLLSIGKDDTSNTLAVSAPASLFDQVSKRFVDLEIGEHPQCSSDDEPGKIPFPYIRWHNTIAEHIGKTPGVIHGCVYFLHRCNDPIEFFR